MFSLHYFCASLTIKSEACAGFLMDSTVLAEMVVLSGTISERIHLKVSKTCIYIRKKQNLIINPSSPKADVIQCTSFYPLSLLP